MSSAPNVLYLHSHDTGRCTQPYGYPIAMPAFQAFAERAAVFRKAFSAAPTCSPSRAALLTGQAPHSAGMVGLAHRGFALSDPSQHLAAFLSAQGYRTVLAGHQHLTSGDARELGYQEVHSTHELPGEKVAANAIGFLDRRAKNGDERPFFLDVGFSESHRPFRSSDAASARYVAPLAGLADTPEIRQDVADFHESLRALDACVSRVLDAIDERGLRESTVVILTTDHGPAFPGMKGTLTDGGLGVGLLLSIPGVTVPGSVFDALVSQIDLYPTICDLLGVAPPKWLQGVSLLPLLTGSTSSVRDAVFGEVTFHAAYEPQRAIRTDRWTYIRRFGERRSPVLPNIDASPALEWLLEHGFAGILRDDAVLYDNALDPLQRTNLAGSSSLAAIERELAVALEAWMAATSDPLLTGMVPLPAGAVVNRASDVSPDGELVSTGYE